MEGNSNSQQKAVCLPLTEFWNFESQLGVRHVRWKLCCDDRCGDYKACKDEYLSLCQPYSAHHADTVKPVLRRHCHERPSVLIDPTFLAEGPTFKGYRMSSPIYLCVCTNRCRSQTNLWVRDAAVCAWCAYTNKLLNKCNNAIIIYLLSSILEHYRWY